jgi:hypothetical protein
VNKSSTAAMLERIVELEATLAMVRLKLGDPALDERITAPLRERIAETLHHNNYTMVIGQLGG